jgi:hypothetical protein
MVDRVDMGYHLEGDVKHDFGSQGVALKYFIQTPHGRKTDERDVVNYFFTNTDPGGPITYITNRDARLKSIKSFTIPKKTKTFEKWDPPVLFPGGNSQIGVVQDAGKFITQELGAQHVLTFGSILDPAGKPIEPQDDPIWFDPGPETEVEIKLEEFGFDPTVISSLILRRLTAGTVQALFKLPNGTILDAIKANVAVEPYGDKPINQTNIEKSGFFTSIEKAEQLLPGDKTLYYIGKTLGDTTLVASCMPSFQGGIPNPFYGVEKPGWQDWGPPPTRREYPSMRLSDGTKPPTAMMLKTGDRLNHCRAFIKTVPSILEQPAGKGRAVRQYEFIPGDVTLEATRKAILEGYVVAIGNIQKRYDELIAEFEASIEKKPITIQNPATRRKEDVERTVLKPQYSNFSGDNEIKKTEGLARAGQLVLFIVRGLRKVKVRVLQWANEWTRNEAQKITTMTPETEADVTRLMNNFYNGFNEVVARSIPQGSLMDSRRRVNRKIIVCQLTDSKVKDWPLPAIDIALMNAFIAVRDGGNKIYHTDLYKRFFAVIEELFPGEVDEEGKPLVPPVTVPGQQMGGAGDDEWLEDIRDPEALALREPIFDEKAIDAQYNASFIKPLAQAGGGFKSRTRGFSNNGLDMNLLKDSFPNIYDFREFVNTALSIQVPDNILFQLLLDLWVNQKSRYIEDPILLDDLLDEMKTMFSSDNRPGTITPVQPGDLTIPDNAPTTATLLLTAYTYQVNAENAGTFFGTPELILDEQFNWFFTQYQMFLAAARADFRITRQGIQLVDSPFLSVEKAAEVTLGVKRGREDGLERSGEKLSKNAITPVGGSVRRGLYERLRERSRSVGTYRVRQSASKSTTRRQRKHLDRV